MKIEHIAFNVADPVAFAAWYVRHLGLRIVRHLPQAAETHFLADDQRTVLEIYHNPAAQVPDYRAMDPLLFHLAFSSTDPEADADRLVAAGASRVAAVRPPDGSLLLMLRDPWGVALQLCLRSKPLIDPA